MIVGKHSYSDIHYNQHSIGQILRMNIQQISTGAPLAIIEAYEGLVERTMGVRS